MFQFEYKKRENKKLLTMLMRKRREKKRTQEYSLLAMKKTLFSYIVRIFEISHPTERGHFPHRFVTVLSAGSGRKAKKNDNLLIFR